MTGPEIMTVVGFIVMLFGVIFGIWKYLDGKLTSARKWSCPQKTGHAQA